MSGFSRYHLWSEVARRLPLPQVERNTLAVFIPGHIGDILHAVPMIHGLRNHRPEVPISWLVGPWGAELAERYRDLADEIILFGPMVPTYTRGKQSWNQSWPEQWRAAWRLRKKGIDCLWAPADPIGRFLANVLRPRLWVGIGDWRPPRVHSRIQTHFQPYEKDRYEADALAGLLQPLGISLAVKHLEYTVHPSEREAATDFLRREGILPEKPLAVLAPGSGWEGKNWLPERFGIVAEWLASEKGFQVAWVGSSEERRLKPVLKSRDWDWMGKTPLPLLAAIFGRTAIFVGNDSGLLHLAAAVGTSTVSLWGPTSPGKWAPRGPRHRFIRKMERCEGCIYWDYREKCRHDRACMKAIGVEEVKAAISAVLFG